MTSKKTHLIAVRVTDADASAYQELARKRGEAVSVVMREAIRAYLDRQNKPSEGSAPDTSEGSAAVPPVARPGIRLSGPAQMQSREQRQQRGDGQAHYSEPRQQAG